MTGVNQCTLVLLAALPGRGKDLVVLSTATATSHNRDDDSEHSLSGTLSGNIGKI